MKHRKKEYYIAVVLLMSLVPSLGMLWQQKSNANGKEELKGFPQLYTEEDGWNHTWLSDAGSWFETHFAFRRELITADAKMKSTLQVSANDQVICGSDGWLYYRDSLADYQGTERMSQRELFNVSHTLALIQEYAEKKGVAFLFVPVPNKNSLYGEHMPYYDQVKESDEKNLTALLKELDLEKVHYTDLYPEFAEAGKVLYHKTDSHWTNEGAAIAADQILSALEIPHVDYAEETYEVRKDFYGDLEEMLYPADPRPEEEVYYTRDQNYTYSTEETDNFAYKVSTSSDGEGGSLVMYRDSFCNALLPFLAESFTEGYFSRGEPYYLDDLDTWQADNLILERAERFLPKMAKNTAVMAAPEREEVPENSVQIFDGEIRLDSDDEKSEVSYTTSGRYQMLEGSIPEKFRSDRAKIYAQMNGECVYEAFPVTLEDGNEWGYRMYLPAQQNQTIHIKIFLI